MAWPVLVSCVWMQCVHIMITCVRWPPYLTPFGQHFVNTKHIYWYYLALTHWCRVMCICVGNLTIAGSDNGLSPGWRRAIIWTNAGILLIGPLGTKLSEFSIEIQTFSFKKIHLKMSSGKRRPFCLGLIVLKVLNVDKVLFICFDEYINFDFHHIVLF